MLTVGYISEKIQSDKTFVLESVTALSVHNYGSNDMYLSVNGVKRKIPAFNATYGVPVGSFNIQDGLPIAKMKLEFEFTNTGTGDAILDYKKLSNSCEE